MKTLEQIRLEEDCELASSGFDAVWFMGAAIEP